MNAANIVAAVPGILKMSPKRAIMSFSETPMTVQYFRGKRWILWD